MSVKDSINYDLENYKNSDRGEPWATLDGRHPIFLPNVGWIEVIEIKTLPVDHFADDYRSYIGNSDLNKVYRFKVDGSKRVWEAEVNFNSWDGPTWFNLYEVVEQEKVVKEWVRL